jgi:hypothetical protein
VIMEHSEALLGYLLMVSESNVKEFVKDFLLV